MPYKKSDIVNCEDPDQLAFYAFSPVSSEANRWAVAANPHTPADVLDLLAEDNDPILVSHIPYNENTSAETLTKMWETKTDAEDNPFYTVFGNPNIPEQLALANLGDNSVVFQLLQNMKISGGVLDAIVKANSSDISRILLMVNLHKDRVFASTVDFMVTDLINSNSHYYVGVLAKFPNISLETSWKLMDYALEYPDKAEWVYGNLTQNPGTHPDIITGLFDVPFHRVRESKFKQNLAEHLNTPVPLLRVLSNHPLGVVRAKVAKNPNTPYEVLLMLHADNTVVVNRALESNVNWVP